jgi:hypothetical protein
LSEEEKDGAVAPAEPVHTPLSEIVDKPRLQTDTSPAVDPPRQAAPVEKPERKSKVDDETRIRGLIRETIEERDKRQALERERDQYKRAWEEHQRTLSAKTKAPVPDMFRDPQAYTAYVEQMTLENARQIAEERSAPLVEKVTRLELQLSERSASQHLGPEKWKKLNDWIEQQGEQFKNWAISQPDPYFAAYEQYRQRTTFERLGNDDIDTLIEKEVAKRLAAQRGPIDAPDGDIEEDDADFDAPKPKPAAPKSFASSRSADPARDPGGRFTGPKPLGAILAEKSPNRRKR